MNFKKFLILVIGIYLAIFLILPQTEYQPADPGIKILQIKDFIRSGYSNFVAYYPARELDSELKFFPVRPPFAYIVSDNPYYVFPYFVTILLTPFYLAGGVFALNFLSLILGIVTLYFIYKISIVIGMTDKFRKAMLIFSAFGSSLSISAFMFGEGIHATLLVTMSVFFILRAKKFNENSFWFFLSGCLAGFSVFLRIELALFCFLFLAGIILFRMYSNRFNILLLVIGLLIPAILLIYANYKVTGNIFGLRGIEFIEKSGTTYPVQKRFFNLLKALVVTEKGLGLFTAWPVFLYLIPFFMTMKKTKVSREILFLLFISLSFTLSVPFLVKNDDGSIFGPRFTTTLQPMLILSVFYSIDLLSGDGRFSKLISYLKFAVSYSVILVFFGYIVLFLFLKNSERTILEMDKNISGKLIIMRNEDLYSLVFPSFHSKYIVTIEENEALFSFIQKHSRKLPENISIISFSANGSADLNIPSGFQYEFTGTYSRNGILIRNMNLKPKEK
ncbi:MAG: hypothetical protein IT569_10100 [Leptospiraceae bacterium]|nr:hypothetical protein [Leptospiraceae bacterium]